MKSLFSIISLENDSQENLLNIDKIMIDNNGSPIIQTQEDVKIEIMIDNLPINAHFILKLQAEDNKDGVLIFFLQSKKQ